MLQRSTTSALSSPALSARKQVLGAVRTTAVWTVIDSSPPYRAGVVGVPSRLAAQGTAALRHSRPEGQLLCLREEVDRDLAGDEVVEPALALGSASVARDVAAGDRQNFVRAGEEGPRGGNSRSDGGFRVVACRAAPDDSGLTLSGFLRGRSMNFYIGAERLSTARQLAEG